MSDKKVIDDKVYCETIATSIADIIRFSLNDEFRKRCSELFGVHSTAQIEKEISKRLISLIQDTGAGSKKSGKKSTKKKDKENLEERCDISDEEKTDELTNNAECESETASENTLQRSWLQISSQQYRAEIKRKFYSQPLYAQPCRKDVEFSGSSSGFSDSQPTSSSSVEGMCARVVSDDGVSFCKKKFKESFEENARKYFKKNLKYKDINI